MKTIDHVKKYLKEWPEGCTFICVDDDGQIWLNKGSPAKANYNSLGCWNSSNFDTIREFLSEEKLEDNDKVITKEDWSVMMENNVEQQQWSMDDFNEQLKELLRRAGQNGIAVNRIEASYMDAGTMGSGKNFVLRDVDVEYRM